VGAPERVFIRPRAENPTRARATGRC